MNRGTLIHSFIHSFIYLFVYLFFRQREADVDLRLINSTMCKDQTTTPGNTYPTLYEKCVGSLTSPADHNSEDAGDVAYGLSSLSEKSRISNHLQMSLQRQHILLSYFKTLSVGPVWDSNALPTELTGRRRLSKIVCLVFRSF